MTGLRVREQPRRSQAHQELIGICRHRVIERLYEITCCANRVSLRNAWLDTSLAQLVDNPSIEHRECFVKEFSCLLRDGRFGRHFDLSPAGVAETGSRAGL